MSADSSAGGVVAAPTRLESLASAAAAALPDRLRAVPNHAGELTYETDAGHLLETAVLLRDSPGLKFEMCMDVCGVDYLEHGRAEWKTEDATSSGFSRGVARGTMDGPMDEPTAAGRRFAVVYHLLSISLNPRL